MLSIPENEESQWVRGPKRADLRNVSIFKIIEAHEQKGINVRALLGGKNSLVTKDVVVDIPSKTDMQENR